MTKHDRIRQYRIDAIHSSGAGLSSKALVAKLKWNREWLQTLRDGKRAPGDSDRAINLMVGCLQTIAQCGRPSLGDWLDRKRERRRTLKDTRNRFRSDTGTRVLRQLVDLAVSEVEACSWRKGYWVGALPIGSEPRPVTTKQRETGRINMAKLHAERGVAKNKLEKARKRRSA